MPVDVPKYKYVGKEDFETPWHLASWVPADPEGPTVLMNRESPILLEAIRYHQEHYSEAYADEVREVVMHMQHRIEPALAVFSQG